MTSIADDTQWLDATAQADLVRTGQVTATELLEGAIERIERLDPALNAVVIRWFDHARELARNPLPSGPFTGVPFLLKDLWSHFTGQTLSNGSKAMKAAAPVSTADTTLVARCKAAGFVTAGRTNSPEFGALPTTEPEAWGPTRNPWSTDHSPGGSSGGSAAAVAAGMVSIAHASDGGGSIRIPAANCGLVGLKPSQGRVSLGPFRDESNLSVELCVSRSVRDTARFLDAVQGPGVGDTVIAPAPTRAYIDEVGAPVGTLRIGLLDHHPFGHEVHPECATAARNAAALLEQLGHHVEASYPDAMKNSDFTRRFSAMWSTNMAVSTARMEALLGRAVTPDDIELHNWVQVQFAKGVSGVDYALALAANVEFRRAVQQWWHDGWDLLVTPTLAEPPATVGSFRNDPDQPMAPLIRAGQIVAFTPAFNSSGQPAISLPLHWTPDGLPVGVQLVAAYGREDLLIRVAAQLEQAQPWAHRRPG